MNDPAPSPHAVAEARDLLAELVDIPSPSGSEGAIVDRLEEICLDWGMTPTRVPTETGRDCLVLGPRDPALVIAAHVDTIDPTWPAGAVVDGDVVHGLGAVDDKGGVVSCLLATRSLARDGNDLGALGVSFAFPVDEERGGSGSRALALALRPRYAIALEATGFAIGTAEIGDIEALIHVHGRSAHGALAELGENAIDGAIALIGALPGLALDHHSHRLLGTSSAEIGSISAGTDYNTIPDRCTFKIGVRVVPGQSAAETVAALERLAAGHGGRIELVEVTAPFETPDDSPLVQGLAAATLDVTGEESEAIGVPAWTDAHNFVDFAGSLAVVFGPGDFATAHTKAEHVDAARVAECAEIFVRLSRRGWR